MRMRKILIDCVTMTTSVVFFVSLIRDFNSHDSRTPRQRKKLELPKIASSHKVYKVCGQCFEAVCGASQAAAKHKVCEERAK